MLTLENLPGNKAAGTRQVPFGRELYIEREDFLENPPKKFFRLSPGKEVRLMGAYIIKCEKVIKDEDGRVVELHCTYDPETKSGSDKSGKKVKGVIHWVAAAQAARITVRMYGNLFTKENPEAEEDFTACINPHSLATLENVPAEPAAASAPPGTRFQFMRKGYFYLDPEDLKKGKIVYNYTVGLRDSWAKMQK